MKNRDFLAKLTHLVLGVFSMRKYLLTTFILILICSCANEYPYQLSFCTNLTPEMNCENDRNIFLVGDRVYVLLQSEKPFIEKQMISTLYIVGRIKRAEISQQAFTINADDKFVFHYTDFGQQSTGTYQFEFTNGSGEILADETIEIQ